MKSMFTALRSTIPFPSIANETNSNVTNVMLNFSVTNTELRKFLPSNTSITTVRFKVYFTSADTDFSVYLSNELVYPTGRLPDAAQIGIQMKRVNKSVESAQLSYGVAGGDSIFLGTLIPLRTWTHVEMRLNYVSRTTTVILNKTVFSFKRRPFDELYKYDGCIGCSAGFTSADYVVWKLNAPNGGFVLLGEIEVNCTAQPDFVNAPCDDVCINGGKCVSNAWMSFGCWCPLGFCGKFCEENCTSPNATVGSMKNETTLAPSNVTSDNTTTVNATTAPPFMNSTNVSSTNSSNSTQDPQSAAPAPTVNSTNVTVPPTATNSSNQTLSMIPTVAPSNGGNFTPITPQTLAPNSTDASLTPPPLPTPTPASGMQLAATWPRNSVKLGIPRDSFNEALYLQSVLRAINVPLSSTVGVIMISLSVSNANSRFRRQLLAESVTVVSAFIECNETAAYHYSVAFRDHPSPTFTAQYNILESVILDGNNNLYVMIKNGSLHNATSPASHDIEFTTMLVILIVGGVFLFSVIIGTIYVRSRKEKTIKSLHQES
eukprot:PhF_6_TR23775/c0_g1_i2/m.33258